MSEHIYFVKAEWDVDAEVWFVTQTDVPGLVAEAGTVPELLSLLDTLIPELIELNTAGGTLAVSYSVMLDHLTAHRTAA